MPKWMDDCVASYKKKNPDDSEDQAWAVCTAAYKKKFGRAPAREDLAAVPGLEYRTLSESYKAHLVVEESEPDSEYAYTISGTVIPAPSTEHGTYSRNHRLYTETCIKESFDKSIAFLQEDVATIHSSHASAGSFFDSGGLPIGKVTELWMDDGAMKFRGGFADTSEGRDVCSLIEAGILERVSLRTRDWKSRREDEVGDLENVEVMEWFVLHGIDFTEVPGLDGTRVVKEAEEEEYEEEEQDMDLKDLTLAQLQEERPDLIAEVADGAAPEPTVEYQTPPDVALEMAIHKVSNAGAGSLVFDYLAERVESEEGLTDELLQEAREHAATTLYGRHAPAPPSNLKGEGSPAPDPDEGKEDGDQEPELSEEQREMIHLAGGG